MLKEIATIAKTKLWFATVNRYKGHQARKQLEEYVKTLSPERQAWANELRARLDAAKSPDEAALILRKENDKLEEKHARLAERIDRVQRSVTTA